MADENKDIVGFPWNSINAVKDLMEIWENKNDKVKLFFKHSKRCNISDMALSRFERNWNLTETTEVELYFIDLIAYRDVSNMLSQLSSIIHQSPQVIVFRNDEVIHTSSHGSIDAKTIQDIIKLG